MCVGRYATSLKRHPECHPPCHPEQSEGSTLLSYGSFAALRMTGVRLRMTR